MADEKQPRRAQAWLKIYGAREHNLKNINVALPKGKLTVITGPSGSGKSSLALDILYTEGKRRYMESLSSYARQFLGIAKKPDVDRIEGLCPAIAIEQKTVGHNPRSTVGTITEIYDYLRVLFARIGVPHCPNCSARIQATSPERITSMILDSFANSMITIAAPIATQKKGEFTNELLALFADGHYRFQIDGTRHKFNAPAAIKSLKLKKTHRHNIDVLIDMFEVTVDERARLNEAVEKAVQLGNGMCAVIAGDQQSQYSTSRMCITCGYSLPELEPRMFSFNSPLGACQDCDGLGKVSGRTSFWRSGGDEENEWGYAGRLVACKVCRGKRLSAQALAVTVGDQNIFQLCELSVKKLARFFKRLKLGSAEQEIGASIIREVSNRLKFLVDVGLGYLSLNRTARTLSGGEGQRIRLATQIGSALSGVLYVLDEPSIGLHQRDNDRLITTLKKLRDLDNTVVVVEHDLDTMRQADYLIDMGPAAGVHGGQITAVGTPEKLAKNKQSLSGAYLSGRRAIATPKQRRTPKGFFTLFGASANNLKNIDVQFPLGVLCGVSGVSGSGKSSLIFDELVDVLHPALYGVGRARHVIDADRISPEVSQLKNMVIIDQSPIGRTPRSNPATYLGVFNDIRALFARLPESNVRGYTQGRFSFNVPSGRCAECNGDGSITVSMHFLPDVTMVCKECKGARYNHETLQITFKNKNIADILNMTALEALEFFASHKNVAKRLQLLCDVGLEYLKLGQPSTTLSGGEAQRIKLVEELAKRGNDTLYILDEPTTGLHNSDIEKLLTVFNRLVDKGNSMIVIEHNLDLLKTVDYLIDLGPEGGDAGGSIVAAGTPDEVARSAKSHTGRYLRALL